MNAIAVIPARGGSKRIPRKNMVQCAGKPLLAYTIAAAKASRLLGRVLLSTDDPEIAAYGREQGIEVPYLRPPELARDDTPMVAVLQDLERWLSQEEENAVESIVLLQPTSPLRTARHIDEAIALFRAHPEAASIVSVVKPPHIFHPLKMSKPSDHGLVPFIDNGVPVVGHRNLPPAYARNGPAVLVSRTSLICQGELYGSPSIPYVMSARDSIDVDEPVDLTIAEVFLQDLRDTAVTPCRD